MAKQRRELSPADNTDAVLPALARALTSASTCAMRGDSSKQSEMRRRRCFNVIEDITGAAR